MDIPAIYSVFKGGELRAAPVKIEGTAISFESEPVRSDHSAKDSDERMPILAVDVRGLSKRGLDDRLLMNLEFPGCDIWFLTFVKDIEDIFDCFMGNIAKVLIPYHTTRNDLVMKEAYDVSENCMPVLFVHQGRVLCREEYTKDIRTAADEAARIGFREIVVFDTDSTMKADDWRSLQDRFPGLIPFVRKNDRSTDDLGFGSIISDL